MRGNRLDLAPHGGAAPEALRAITGWIQICCIKAGRAKANQIKAS